jgi:hypothetical protein
MSSESLRTIWVEVTELANSVEKVGSDWNIEVIMDVRPERGPSPFKKKERGPRFRLNGSVTTVDLDRAVRGEFFFDLQNR